MLDFNSIVNSLIVEDLAVLSGDNSWLQEVLKTLKYLREEFHFIYK